METFLFCFDWVHVAQLMLACLLVVEKKKILPLFLNIRCLSFLARILRRGYLYWFACRKNRKEQSVQPRWQKKEKESETISPFLIRTVLYGTETIPKSIAEIAPSLSIDRHPYPLARNSLCRLTTHHRLSLTRDSLVRKFSGKLSRLIPLTRV